MAERSKGGWGKLILLNIAVAAWAIYDIFFAGGEAPRQAVLVMNYIVLGCALIGLVGSTVKYMSAET